MTGVPAGVPDLVSLAPNTFVQGASDVSQVFVDGMPIEDMIALQDANSSLLTTSHHSGPNQFWATPPRSQYSTICDTLDVGIGSPKMINEITFYASKYPCQIWVQYYNKALGQWITFNSATNGSNVLLTIGESVPARIHVGTFDLIHRHPQHRAAGHWEKYTIPVQPVKADRVRLVLTRIPSAKTPLDVNTGQPAAYSLAIKDLQFGYLAGTPSDVPNVSMLSQRTSDGQPFASTSDLLGSNVEFSFTTYGANDLLWPALAVQKGQPYSQVDGLNEIWKSEPQPVPNAVVNLYVDARDPKGNAQVIDRFWMDTPTPGVDFNLYYSNDQPLPFGDAAPARSEPLRWPAVQAGGSPQPFSAGINFPGKVAYLDLQQQYFGLNPSVPWWAGLTFEPSWASTDTTDTFVIIDTPYFTLSWTNGSWLIQSGGQSTNAYESFKSGDTLSIIVAYDGSSTLQAYFNTTQVPAGNKYGTTLPAIFTQGSGVGSTWRLAGSLSTPAVSIGNYLLSGFVLKQETLDVTDEFDWFAQTPATYLVPSDLGSATQWDYTANSLVRIAPFYQSGPPPTPAPAHAVLSAAGFGPAPIDRPIFGTKPVDVTGPNSSRNPYGVVGGPITDYTSLTWTPVNRNFTLHKGYVKINPVKANFWKFEFSNLAAQPYQNIQPQLRTVQMFTPDVMQASSVVPSSAGMQISPSSAGTGVNIASANTPLFTDQARNNWLRFPSRSYPGYSPTEALYSSDPAAQQRLAALNPAFKLQPWHGQPYMPRFTSTQKHYYQQVPIIVDSNIAYSVAVSSLRMFLVDYTVRDDTADYFIPFYNNALFDQTKPGPNWALNTPSGIISGGSTGPTSPVKTTSLPMLSQSAVRGLQFATVQSPAVELLKDDQFLDPTMAMWQPYGLARLTYQPSVDVNGAGVVVSRDASGRSWGFIEFSDWGTTTAAGATMTRSWGSVEALAATNNPTDPGWGGLEDLGSVVTYGGITGSPASYVQPSPAGRLYAAARIFTSSRMLEPLSLEIVGSDGTVLARQDVLPKQGGVTEWWVGYTLGQTYTGTNAPVIPKIWASQEAFGTWGAVEAGAVTWQGAIGTGVAQPYGGKVTARLVQNNASHDTWTVDALSLFEDSILWEFSADQGATWMPGYDIRNDPDGVVLFNQNQNLNTAQDPLAVASLIWRVTTYRANQWVNYLYLRPWYSSRKLGIPTRESISHGGPNINEYDQYPSVEDSPFFKMWDEPIPQEWWFAYRKFLFGIAPNTPIIGSVSYTDTLGGTGLYYPAVPLASGVLGSALIIKPSNVVPSLILGGEAIVYQPRMIVDSIIVV